MTQKENILQELNELKSLLATVTPQNVYTVPVGYFDGLAAQILNRIKAIEVANSVEELGYLSPMLSRISKQMPYAVPAGYFEGLAEKAMQSVFESSDYQTAKEEIETLSPLLSGLKKQMSARPGHSDGPYSIPQGYFETLTENINTEENKPAIRVISITSRKWFRYAAAAVIAGVIVMAGFLVVKDKQSEEGQSIVKFEKKLNKEIKKMSDEELNDFIQFTDAGLTGEEKVSNKTTDEVKELLKDVPDTELKEFLEETSDAEPDSETSSMLN